MSIQVDANTDTTDGTEDEGAGIFAEINITPLTDIFLVLLIIFMVTSSVMSELGVDVNLPSASSAIGTIKEKSVVVTLQTSGNLKVNDVQVSAGNWSHFEALIKKSFELTKSRQVILEGDKNAVLGQAIEVMDRARRAGAQEFAIAAKAE